MSIAIYRAQVAIPQDTGLPEDVITNTWHFNGLDAGQTVADDIDIMAFGLDTFYTSIDGLFAVNLGTAATVKIYDLSDPMPRVPINVSTTTLTTSTDDGLPSEVALCLSYKALIHSGDIAARRRGRIFLGPFAETVSELNGGRIRPTTTMRTTILNAATVLMNYTTSNDVPWAVYSPTEDAASPVVGGWVDNAWDTVRSRGTTSTLRTTF